MLPNSFHTAEETGFTDSKSVKITSTSKKYLHFHGVSGQEHMTDTNIFY